MSDPGASGEWVSDQLRRTKALAKARPGNTCTLSNGERVVDLMSQRELPEPADTALLQAPG